MNLSIGLTGLKAAQRAIELVGTNLANAATEGYHRQRINLSALVSSSSSMRVSIGGVRVDGSTRSYDVLLEREHIRMRPEMGQIEQELSALASIEAVMGNIDGDPLGESLGEFFAALNDLAADPTQLAYAQQVVWAGDALTTNLRSLGDFLVTIKEQLREQASHLMEEVNTRAATAAELNREINLAFQRGVSSNLLQDQRDQAIVEMAELADVQITGMSANAGQVCVHAWGTPLVMNTQGQEMEVGLTENGLLGVSVKGMASYSPYATGGKIGGLIQLYNEVIPDLENSLNSLANQIMYYVNNQHAQGVGKNGSFTELDGVAVNSSITLANWEPPVSDGTLCLRVTDDAGGIVVHDIHVAADQTVDYVIDQINLVSEGNITANMADGRLYLRAVNGYKFDFIPDYSDTTGAVNEVLLGASVTTLRDAYFTGDNAADELQFVLGSTVAEEMDYTIGNGSKDLYTVVQEINAWSEAQHAGWQAASAVYDASAGGFRLKLEAWDFTGSGNVTVNNTGAVVWGGTAVPVAVAPGGFSQVDAEAGMQPEITFHNIFTDQNQTFTFKVVHPDGAGNSGDIGIDDDLSIEVYNENNELVKTLSIGNGYPAGDQLEVIGGMCVSFGTGTITHGEQFTVTAHSSSDDTMFLASAGLNTFFHGIGAVDMEVRSEFYDDPFLFASCIGPEMSDNENIQKIAQLQNDHLAGLGGATPSDYFNDIVTNLGQQVMLREARSDALGAIYRELQNQRDLVSGVDPNEEAANLLVFERMFQSMSKFITVQDTCMQVLMDVL